MKLCYSVQIELSYLIFICRGEGIPKNIQASYGKIKNKKNLSTPSNPKIFMHWPRKNSYKENINGKLHAARKFKLPLDDRTDTNTAPLRMHF